MRPGNEASSGGSIGPEDIEVVVGPRVAVQGHRGSLTQHEVDFRMRDAERLDGVLQRRRPLEREVGVGFAPGPEEQQGSMEGERRTRHVRMVAPRGRGGKPPSAAVNL